MKDMIFLRYMVLESAMACEDETMLDFVWKLMASTGIERS